MNHPGARSPSASLGNMGSNIRACVVQAAPVAFDLEATLTKVERLTRAAASEGAELIVFPEAFLSAYPKGLDFGTRVGSRSPEGRRWFQRYFESSIDVPGPATEQLGALCNELGVHLVIGAIERGGGTLYCTALAFDESGTLVVRHRKLVPTAMERVIWGSGDGSTLTVAPTKLGRLGTVICWENYMPLLRTAMYRQRVELYCAPTVDHRDSWVPTIQHIATEGRCFVMSSCQFATRADFPADYASDEYGDDPSTILIRGGSCIADSFGQLLAGPIYDSEALLHAELPMERIVQGRFDLDVTGHYARPDVFSLEVDEQPRQG